MKCVPLPLRKRRKNMLNLYSMNLFLLLLFFLYLSRVFFISASVFLTFVKVNFFDFLKLIKKKKWNANTRSKHLLLLLLYWSKTFAAIIPIVPFVFHWLNNYVTVTVLVCTSLSCHLHYTSQDPLVSTPELTPAIIHLLIVMFICITCLHPIMFDSCVYLVCLCSVSLGRSMLMSTWSLRVPVWIWVNLCIRAFASACSSAYTRPWQ